MATTPSRSRVGVPLKRPMNAYDQERENFEKNQYASITKAINSLETPVKEKHIRSAIIGTFKEHGAGTFWNIVSTSVPLQSNPIVCWKFCHTLHKLLREGHPNVLPESQKYRQRLPEIGLFWNHLRGGYGPLINSYCKLVACKLEFHRKNPKFPGNLVLTNEMLDNIGESDVNNYFQLSVEIFDYMDEILTLQSVVFNSMDMSRSNSMTAAGQCRLAPLILCIQDSSQLYDFSVKILFKLHASLPADVLCGHRDRFFKQFDLLKNFYAQARVLQYFKHLIQIPSLPDRPPDFLILSNLSAHISPVVILPPRPESPDNDSIDMLVDTTDSLVDFDTNGSSSPDQFSEKDLIIDQLRSEIEQLRSEIHRIKLEDQRIIDELRHQLMTLDGQMAEMQQNVIIITKENDELSKKAHSHEIGAAARLVEIEKRSKASEEKFAKMKDVYQKLRDEHVNLLRGKAEIDKQLIISKQSVQEAQKSKEELVEKLGKAESDRSVIEEVLQKSANESTQQLAMVTQTKEDLERSKQALEEKLSTLSKQNTTLDTQINELKDQKSKLEIEVLGVRQESQDTQQKMTQDAQDKHRLLLQSCVAEAERNIETAMKEIENPAAAAVVCPPEYLLNLINPMRESIAAIHNAHAHFVSNQEDVEELLKSTINFSHLMSELILLVKAASNGTPDIEGGETLVTAGKLAGSDSLKALLKMRTTGEETNVAPSVAKVKDDVEELHRITEALVIGASQNSTEQISDMIEDEMQQMDRAIEKAAMRISEMLANSRKNQQGVKLEVNEKVLDSCTGLMQAIRVLVQRSRDLQNEIVNQGKGSASVKEFYKRNHRWTEGFISAAKAVGYGAKYLVDAADKVVAGEGKFEVLMVASQEIAASTAQLVVASKVKADRNSNNLKQLSTASKGVTDATGAVVATAKNCAQLLEDSEILDFTKMSLHQAKRFEMESQVRVLELESNLEKERLRLAGLRKQHYMLAGPSEGWEAEVTSP